MERLIPIGRFAQLSSLSIRALRLYDESGLLRPEAVREDTRYRYYAPAQLEGAVLIARLRQVEMPLEEIERYLRGAMPEREAVIASHRTRLRQRAAEAQQQLRALDDLAADPSGRVPRSPRVTSMVRKYLYDQPVLRIKVEWTLEDGMPSADMAHVFASLKRQGLIKAAPPYSVWFVADEQGDIRGEVGVPTNVLGEPDGEVEPGILPEGEVATIGYTGPDKDIGTAYRQLWSEIEAAGLIPEGRPRDVYLTAPDATPDPNDYFTEVVWPVKH